VVKGSSLNEILESGRSLLFPEGVNIFMLQFKLPL
jgi:hypothetical protein